MHERTTQWLPRWGVAITIAVMCHLMALLLFRGWSDSSGSSAAPTHNPDLADFSMVALPSPAPPPEPEQERQEGQHVDLPREDPQERPDEARFLDSQNRSTELEQVSQDDLSDQPLLQPTHEPQPASDPAPTTSPEEAPQAAPPNTPAVSDHSTSTAGEPEEFEALAPGEDGELRSSDAEQAAQPRGSDDDPESEPAGAVDPYESSDGLQPDGDMFSEDDTPAIDLSGFRPTLENIGPLAQPPRGGRSDYLELPDGDRTQINAHQALYRGFFQRVRLSLLAHWNPKMTLRRHDPSNRIYGTSDRYTLLRVTLNSDGSLRHAIVERASGVPPLDEEALRAFEAAGPFPNPPIALQNERGQIEFRFGFMVSFRRSSNRLFFVE